jgi:sialic acid synthase SpsE
MNLDFLRVLKSAFGFPVGLSDHTENSLAAAAAVALGVEWIEKHITLDRKSPGFDHAYAMEPDPFARYVSDIRAVSGACRRRKDKVGPAEAKVGLRARRALYAARDMEPGETLSEGDVLIVRPAGPLPPNELPAVVGRRSRGKIRRYEPLAWNLLE